MSRRWTYVAFGAALVLLGFFLPQDWYNSLPRPEDAIPDPPIKGVTLLRITLVLDGVLLFWLGRRPPQFRRVPAAERLAIDGSPQDGALSRTSTRWALLVITIAAFALRAFRLNSDLWLDEITPVLMYVHMPVLHVLTSYISSNNHLLNTLLIKGSVTLFGEQEWAVRLPAMLFGVATIPAIYWLSRLITTRLASLCVAFLLATSYHHIFFSQNARGYSAYLLFSVLAAGFLVLGLREDRPRFWALYVLTMFLDFASLLTSGFVLAAHGLIAAAALVVIYRRGASPVPLMRRLVWVFSVTAILVVNLYVTIVPQVYVYSKYVYADPSTGSSPFTLDFWRDLSRGLGAGFGPGWLLGAVPFLVAAAAGCIILLRRQWPVVSALALPPLLTALFLIVQGLTFSPRFFLLGLPFAMVVAVQAAFSAAQYLSGRIGIQRRMVVRGLAVVVILLVGAASLASLARYYATPKQPYRASLEFVRAHRDHDGPVIAIHLMEKGYRFYAGRFDMAEGKDWFSVRSVDALDAVLSSHRHQRPILVTTFRRALRLTLPDLYSRVLTGWKEVKTFPATVGDGDISVWVPERPAETPPRVHLPQ